MIALNKKITLGLSSFQFMAMARRGLFYTFLSIYLRVVLGLSVTETTLLACLTMIANSASQTLVWGKISDKYQARAILVVIGETIASVGYILVYIIHIYLLNMNDPIASAYSIILGLSLLEFFWSMSNLGWSALISDLTTIQERSKLMSIVSCIGGIGRIVGISFSGLLYNWGGEAGGFKNGILFFFASGVMFASAILIWFSTRSSENFTLKKQNVAFNAEENAYSTNYPKSVFRWFLVAIFIVGLGTYSILQIFILYLELDSPIGATTFDIAMIRNSASLATIIVSLIAGFIAHKIGQKNALSIGLLLTVITPILYSVAHNPIQMIIINCLNGVSMAIMNVVGYLIAADLIPVANRGRLFGQYNAVTYISFGVAGTFIGGPIADHFIHIGFEEASTYIITFYVASAISLIGLLFFILKVKYKQSK